MAEEDTTAGPETAASTPDSASAGAAAKAAKDRPCPFCNQAFTSSSLGRHLDLYIKPKNPKPPDGVHDVSEIRKLRGGITRRQPKSGAKGPFAAQTRAASIPTSNTTATSSHSRVAGTHSPVIAPATLQDEVRTHPLTSFNSANWQATGVINNLPPRPPSRADVDPAASTAGQTWRMNEMRKGPDGQRLQRPDYESESMWKLQEAAELGRAAEMALREVLGSLEAAHHRTEPKAVFENFDFFSLSFPGLCLALLPPPTTLFTPVPFPSADSWTLAPPGLKQFEAMNRRVSEALFGRRGHENVPDAVAFRLYQHLGAAWEHWQTMTADKRAPAWSLEVQRAFTRAQEQTTSLRAELEAAKQRIRHLEADYDRLSRCQLPREYLQHPPNTIPVQPSVMKHVDASQFHSGVGEARYDVDALISKWKAAIKTTYRPPRASWSSATAASKMHGTDPSRNALHDDMVMTGALFGVNGPMARNTDRPHADLPDQSSRMAHSHSAVSYETPPRPGVVVGPEDEETTSMPEADEHADGEAGHDRTEAAPTSADQGPVMKRPKPALSPRPGPSGILNVNGKRPLTLSTTTERRDVKVYRAIVQEVE